MSKYLIGYDLTHHAEMERYENLIEAIQKYGTWWHHLDSTWIVVSDQSAETIRDGLLAHIHNDDRLLVAALTGESAWHGFSEKGASWLKANL